MNLAEMRAKMQTIVAKLDEFNTLENYSDEDVKSINGLNDEYTSLKNNIETREKLESMQADSSKSARKVAPEAVATPRVEVIGNKFDKTMGFKSFGDFAKAVSDKSKGRIDRRFDNTAAYEKFSEDGGVLIPTEFMTEITEKVQGDQSLLARTSNFKISGNHLSLPVDEEEPWNGGIQTYWVGEGQPLTESKSQLKNASWRLHKLAAMVKTTDELLDDAPALESYIKRKAPSAITHKINDVIINGDGVAKPTGIMNSGFKVTVSKEVGQDADTIVYKNLVKMESKHIPSMTSVWLAHPQCREQLRQLKDDNGNAIYMNGGSFANLSTSGFDTLLGKPVIYMMGAMQALGDEGDIMLCDLQYYYSVLKTEAVKQSMSTHLLFDRDMTAFKFITRVDGSCPFTKPVTTQYGNYQMSGFVTLEDR